MKDIKSVLSILIVLLILYSILSILFEAGISFLNQTYSVNG